MLNKGRMGYLYTLSLVFLFLLVAPSVTATDKEQMVFKENTQINLIRFCVNNGTFCSPSAFCNSTVISPSGVTLSNNSEETNQGSYFNLTIRSGLMGNLGTHNVIRTCQDPGGDISGKNFETYSFLVTPSGTDDDSLGQLMLLGLGFLLSGGVIWLGFSKQEPYLVMFGGIVLFLFGLFILLNGAGNYRNTLTDGSALVTLALASYVTARTSLEMLEVI